MDSDTWQLQEAKARFSEVVRAVKRRKKPQVITVHGKKEVMMVPYLEKKAEPKRTKKKQPKTLLDVMKTFPKGVDLAKLIGPRSPKARATDDSLFD